MPAHAGTAEAPGNPGREVTDLSGVETLLRRGLIGGLALVILWSLGQVLLALFAGALLGVFLNSLARAARRRTRLSERSAFALVVGAVALVMVGTAYFLLPGIVDQASQLADSLSSAWTHMSKSVPQFLPGLKMSLTQMISASNLPFRLFGFTSSVTAMLVTGAMVVFIGFYGALDATLYRDGLLRIVPEDRRAEARKVLDALRHALEWWLIGRAITMAAVALLTTICLALLGIHLAITLGLIAGLLTFIPYLGAIVSAIPAVMVGFVQSPATALYVLAVYAGAHAVEGYILGPMVQRRTVHLPPALMLATQAVVGTLFGIGGLMLAAPLAAAGVVLAPYLGLGGREDYPVTEADTAAQK